MTSTTAASEPASKASALTAQLRRMASGRNNPLTWKLKHRIGDVQLKAVAFTASTVNGVCVRVNGFVKRPSGFFFKTDVTFDVFGTDVAFGSPTALAEVSVEPVDGTANDRRNGAADVIWSNAMPRKTFDVESLRDLLQKTSTIVAKYLELAIARDESYLVSRSKEAKAADDWHELAEKNGVAVALVYCVSTGRWVMERRGNDVRYPGTWGLPGGAIENMESPIEAAKRELSEEVGIHNARFVKQVDLGGDPKAVCVVFVVNQESKLRKSVESAAVVWTDYFMDNLIPVMEDQLSVYKDIVASLKKSAPGAVNLEEFTPEFKRWFGSSKVVDHNGKPMRMYHGSTYDIAEFKREFVGHGNDQEGSGFYFTNDPDHAGGYASDTPKENLPAGGRVAGPNIMPTYLRITKPVTNKPLTRVQIQRIIANGDQDALYNFGDVDYDGKAKVIQQAVDAYHDNGHTTKQTLFNLANDFYSGMDGKFLQVVKAVTGYDGVIVDYPNGRVVAVVFGPEQIKSVYNKKPGMRTSRVSGSAEPRTNTDESKFTAYVRDLAEKLGEDADLAFNTKLAGHETVLTFFDVSDNRVEFTVNIVMDHTAHILTVRFVKKGGDAVLELVPESNNGSCVQIIPRDHTKRSRNVVVSNRTKYSVHVDDEPRAVLKATAAMAVRVVNLVTDNKVTAAAEPSSATFDALRNRVLKAPRNISGKHNLQLRSGNFRIQVLVSGAAHESPDILDVRFDRGDEVYANYDYYRNGTLSLVHSRGLAAPRYARVDASRFNDVNHLLANLIKFALNLKDTAEAAAEPGEIEKTVRDGRQYVIALAAKQREWTTKVRGITFHLQNLTDRINENENVLDVQVRITYGMFVYTASLQWFKKRDEIVTSKVLGSKRPNHISTAKFDLGPWISDTCSELLDRLWSEASHGVGSSADYAVVRDGDVYNLVRKHPERLLAKLSEKDVLDAVVHHGRPGTSYWVDTLGHKYGTAQAAQTSPTPQDLGTKLKKVLASREAYAILDKAGPGIDTWLAGGCALLAVAMSRLNIGVLTVLEGRSGNGPLEVQHWVVQAHGYCFDGDGASTPATLLRRWRDVEGVADAALRRATAKDTKSSTYTSALRHDVVLDLENLLRQHLQPEN